MADMTWMTEKWIVSSTNTSDSNFSLGVSTTDVVSFNPDPTQHTIFRTPVTAQTLVNSSASNTGTTAWGTWTASGTSGTFNEKVWVSGTTSAGDSFTITWDPAADQLTCEVRPKTQGLRWASIGAGTAAGALVGAITGQAAGNPRLGLLSGIAAALTGAFTAALAILLTGARTGSSGTWIANDGSSGGGTRPVQKPGDGQDPQMPRPARIA